MESKGCNGRKRLRTPLALNTSPDMGRRLQVHSEIVIIREVLVAVCAIEMGGALTIMFPQTVLILEELVTVIAIPMRPVDMIPQLILLVKILPASSAVVVSAAIDTVTEESGRRTEMTVTFPAPIVSRVMLIVVLQSIPRAEIPVTGFAPGHVALSAGLGLDRKREEEGQ